MPHFDSTITLGTLITVGSVIAVWVAFKARVDVVLDNQQKLLDAFVLRFEKHEVSDKQMFDEFQNRLVDLVASVQRLVGQSEVLRANERRGRS